jgi:hypothetical protein
LREQKVSKNSFAKEFFNAARHTAIIASSNSRCRYRQRSNSDECGILLDRRVSPLKLFMARKQSSLGQANPDKGFTKWMWYNKILLSLNINLFWEG